MEGNARTPPSPPYTREFAHSTVSSRRDWSGTEGNDQDSGDSELSRTTKFPCIEDIADLVQKRLNQTRQQFPKGMEYSGLRLSNSPLSGKITMLCFSKKFMMLTFYHYLGISDPFCISACIRIKWRFTLMMTFFSVERFHPVSREPPTTSFTRS